MGVRVVITGAGGFVGGNLIRQGKPRRQFHFFGLDRLQISFKQTNLEWLEIDLLDQEVLKDTLIKISPNVIVHLAAISDIDYCEANKDLARKVNIDITSHIIDYCKNSGCRLIYFSSDSIFDGNKGKYREADKPEPLHFYGETKVICEYNIKKNLKNWVIVRPSLIVGLPVLETGNSFLWRMLKSLKRGESVAFPRSEVRSPVDVITLTRAVLELAVGTFTGIIHISGNDIVNRFDMAKKIASYFGYPEDLIKDKKPFISSGRALRPADVSLDNSRAKSILNTPMVNLQRGLDLIKENQEIKL